MSSPSLVWKYFQVSEHDSAFAICNECKGKIRRGGENRSSFNTSNLVSHLKCHHDALWKKYQTEAQASLPAKKKDSVVVPIDQAFQNCKKFARDSSKAQGINDRIMEFIVTDDQPFSVVEDKGFRQLIAHLEPRYTVPSRRYFSDVCLPALYDAVATHIHSLIDASVSEISFTTDIWTSDVSTVSMLSLTAQWLDEDFNMKKTLLHAQECSGSHTAAAIREAFEGMFEQWKIPLERVHVVLRDNARNMAKACEDCGVASLGCMAHTLQLAVNEAVLSQRSVSDCVAIGRKVVGHFKHSQVASSRLKDLQTQLGMKTARLQQDVATRWNSTFYMLRSLVEQKRALAAYGVDHALPASLNAYQWSLVENMLTILDPCEQLTRDISSAKATTAVVIPSVEALKRLLKKTATTDQGVKTSKDTLLEAVDKRFGHINEEPLYYLSTILDPRYKDRFFQPGTKARATDMLQDKMSCAPTTGEQDVPQAKKSRVDGNNSLLDMYSEILEENTEPTEEQVRSQTEMQVNSLFNILFNVYVFCLFQ